MDNMIGKRIKERRKELHLTQIDIQKNTSITSGNLSCIENGKYLPSAIALVELSRILDCTTDWILTGNSKISDIYSYLDILEPDEKKLLIYYQKMSISDQEDLLLIAEMKYNKRKDSDESITSNKDDITSEIA